jgi:hypothetical protein
VKVRKIMSCKKQPTNSSDVIESNQQFLQIWNSGADFFKPRNIHYFSIGVKNHYILAEHVVLT